MRLHRNLNQALFESPIDPTRKKLSPGVFDKDNEIHPTILNWLFEIVNNIDQTIVPISGRALVKGSILSYQWLDTSDFDLLLEISEDINDEQYELIFDRVDEEYNDKDIVIPGTNHPLQIFVHRGKFDERNADGIYDLYHGWVKGPYSLKANIDDYIGEFSEIVSEIDLETGKLKRNLIDYDILQQLTSSEIVGLKDRLKKELSEIESSLQKLADKKIDIKGQRHAAFDRNLTPEEITKYGSKNLLPANIMQKLLERYYYMDMLKEIEQMIEDGELSALDIVELKRMFGVGNQR